MKNLSIPIQSKDHAQEVVDFSVKYPKGKITAKTPDQHLVAAWLDEMKENQGWFEISVNLERVKLIYEPL